MPLVFVKVPVRFPLDYEAAAIEKENKTCPMNTENTFKTRRKRAKEELRKDKEGENRLADKEATIETQYALLKEAYIELQKLKIENQELKEKLHQYENPDDGYRKDWTWVAKIVFILEKANKPMATKEIIELLEKREQMLKEHYNKGKFFSAFLNSALKHGRIKREKRKGERGFYYSV